MCMSVWSSPQATRKVLLVDDMRVNRLVLGRMLRLLGFEVIEAENGKAALEQFLCHQESLSCVVLDLQMPVLDGWETAKQLRGLESHGTRVPIVGCTALRLQDNWKAHCTVEDSALRCGFDEVMAKMPSQDQLQAVLCRHVSRSNSPPAVHDAVDSATASESPSVSSKDTAVLQPQ